MKQVKILLGIATLLFIASGCAKKDGIDGDTSFLSTVSSGNLSKIIDISNDNSGVVTVTPLGDGVTSFSVDFGHDGAKATVLPGNRASHVYPEGSFSVTIVSTDLAGKQTTTAYPITVAYRAPESLVPTIGSNANSLSVKATALYTASFLVYWGDVPNEVGTPLAKNATVYHVYAAPGAYNVKVVAKSGNATYTGAATAEVITAKTINPFSFVLPITFEDPAVNYFFGSFGGGQQFSKVANQDATGLNTSATVGKYVRGWENWSGTYSPLNQLVDLSVNKKVKILVYNPDPTLVGKKLNLELEAAYTGTPGNGVGVLKVPFTTSGAWEELVFDFSTLPALPATAKFGQIVFRFNDGYSGNTPGEGGQGSIFYVDNIRLTN